MFVNILSKLIGYYDGRLHSLDLSTEQLSFQPKNGHIPAVVIVARHLYSESSQYYPIENKKELDKIIKLSLTENQFYQVHKSEHLDGYNVMIWDMSAVNHLKANWLIPESVVLANSSDAGRIILFNTEQPFYLSKLGNQLYSLCQSTLINSPLRFSESAGIVIDPEQYQNISASVHKAQLLCGIKKFKPLWIRSFFKTSSLAKISYKKPLLTGAALSLVYLFLTTLYLSYKEYDINKSLESQRDQLDRVLTLDEQTQLIRERLAKVSDVITEQSLVSGSWHVLAPLFTSAARFKRLEYRSGRYILNGDAPSASETLQLLVKQKGVADAKFDGSVSKKNKRERFIISFILTKQGLDSLVQSASVILSEDKTTLIGHKE